MNIFNYFKTNLILLFLFPLSITSIPVIHGAVLLLVFAYALIMFLQGRSSGYVVEKWEKEIYSSVIFLVVIALIVTIFHGINYFEFKNISRLLMLMMVIPAYFYFRNMKFKSHAFWYGLVAGSTLSACVAIYEVLSVWYEQGYTERARGATHPIIFGDLALIMGFMAMAGFEWFRGKAKWQIVLPILAILTGLVASILSQSRGGWVAIPFVVIILFWSSRARISYQNKIIGVVLLMFVFSVAYLMPQTGMRNKLDETVNDIKAYSASGIADEVRGTSIGSRFEMWQASWVIFKEYPLLGVGWGNYRAHAQVLVDRGVRNKSAAEWPHPHNQFLSSLVSGGVLGFVATILLFFVPAKIFYVAARSHDKSSDAKMIATAGLLMIVGFVIFNLSESFLERSRTVSFFVFYLAVCMAGIRNQENTARIVKE